jgi:hypothetical protein
VRESERERERDREREREGEREREREREKERERERERERRKALDVLGMLCSCINCPFLSPRKNTPRDRRLRDSS